MPFCSECGTSTQEEAKFCSKCGKELNPSQTIVVDDFTSRKPVRDVLREESPWAIHMFELRETGSAFLSDSAIASIPAITRMKGDGNYYTYRCVIGEKSIGLFSQDNGAIDKSKGWAVAFPMRILKDVKLIPGRTNLQYSDGDSYVADFWILTWPVSLIKPWPETEYVSGTSFWTKVKEPLDPCIDVFYHDKKDPLHDRWAVCLPFEESGDPDIRKLYAQSLAKQMGHFPEFRIDESQRVENSVSIALQSNAGVQRGWGFEIEF